MDVEILEMTLPSLVSYALIKHSTKANSGVISALFIKWIARSWKNTEHQVTSIYNYHPLIYCFKTKSFIYFFFKNII